MGQWRMAYGLRLTAYGFEPSAVASPGGAAF